MLDDSWWGATLNLDRHFPVTMENTRDVVSTRVLGLMSRIRNASGSMSSMCRAMSAMFESPTSASATRLRLFCCPFLIYGILTHMSHRQPPPRTCFCVGQDHPPATRFRKVPNKAPLSFVSLGCASRWFSRSHCVVASQCSFGQVPQYCYRWRTLFEPVSLPAPCHWPVRKHVHRGRSHKRCAQGVGRRSVQSPASHTPSGPRW